MDERRLPVLSERLRALRGTMTQEEFSVLLEISRPTVGFYENGTRIPDALVLRRIANRYHVSIDWLLGLSDTPAIEHPSSSPTDFTQELAALTTKGYGVNGGAVFEALLHELLESAQDAAEIGSIYEGHAECLLKLCQACHTAARCANLAQKQAEPSETTDSVLHELKHLLLSASYTAHNVLNQYFDLCKSTLQKNSQESLSCDDLARFARELDALERSGTS